MNGMPVEGWHCCVPHHLKEKHFFLASSCQFRRRLVGHAEIILGKCPFFLSALKCVLPFTLFLPSSSCVCKCVCVQAPCRFASARGSEHVCGCGSSSGGCSGNINNRFDLSYGRNSNSSKSSDYI